MTFYAREIGREKIRSIFCMENPLSKRGDRLDLASREKSCAPLGEGTK